MNKSTSLYLDFLRIFAAFGVFLGHANFPWFSNNLFPGDLGHKFVTIFFVLSGYLIAFTVDKKNKGPKKYMVDRFSRLYSVVLPALIFTYLIDFIGKHLHPDFYSPLIAPNNQILRFILNATFLQQIWGLSTTPSTNSPFWSISYEFWYYMLFAVFIYLSGAKKYIGLVIVSLLIGIKILLLLPVWIFGVIVYRLSDKYTIGQKTAVALFAISAVIILGLTFFWDVDFAFSRYPFGKPPLFFSARFIFEWLYGALVALNIFCFNAISFTYSVPSFFGKTIKYLSSITFSLYLFHLPILVFLASCIPYNKSSYVQIFAILFLALLFVNILAVISEKQRDNFKKLFEKIFSLFTSKSVNAK